MLNFGKLFTPVFLVNHFPILQSLTPPPYCSLSHNPAPCPPLSLPHDSTSMATTIRSRLRPSCTSPPLARHLPHLSPCLTQNKICYSLSFLFFVFFFFKIYPICCRFWVMVLPVMGLGVASGSNLMGFGWFWAWFLVLCNGYQWVAGWLVVGCGMAHDGFVGWLAVVVPIFGRFRWFWMWFFFFFSFFVILFYVAPNTQCTIFSGAFF